MVPSHWSGGHRSGTQIKTGSPTLKNRVRRGTAEVGGGGVGFGGGAGRGRENSISTGWSSCYRVGPYCTYREKFGGNKARGLSGQNFR
jgi:hypothetical protein